MVKLKDKDAFKRTNEIKIAAPMLDAIEIKGKLITADMLLTQRKFAKYLVEQRKVDYHFTVKSLKLQFMEKPVSQLNNLALAKF